MTAFQTKELAYCALFTALITIGAFLQIPLPYFDYFTLQFLFVLLAGMLLGARLGVIAITSYVLMGLLGIPVFAAGGGIAYILRPSFGFLLGFIAAAWVSGKWMELHHRSWKSSLTAAFLGLLATYSIGLCYKYVILNYYTATEVSFPWLLLSCFPVDLPGDILLSLLAAGALLRFPPMMIKEKGNDYVNPTKGSSIGRLSAHKRRY